MTKLPSKLHICVHKNIEDLKFKKKKTILNMFSNKLIFHKLEFILYYLVLLCPKILWTYRLLNFSDRNHSGHSLDADHVSRRKGRSSKILFFTFFPFQNLFSKFIISKLQNFHLFGGKLGNAENVDNGDWNEQAQNDVSIVFQNKEENI